MKKLLLIIPITVFILLIFVIVSKSYNLDIKLTQTEIKVNMYDNIDLKDYIVEAVDKKGKILTDDIKISVECDDEDVLNDNNLFIKGSGTKVVTYYIKKLGRKFSSKLTINVITDPNDSDFKPNYDEIEKQDDFNEDDDPTDISDDLNITEEQRNYLNSL